MVLHFLIEEIRLADEEIGTPCRLQKRIGPLRVARIGNDPAGAEDSQCERRRATGMDHLIRRDHERPNWSWSFRCEFHELDGKFLLDTGGAGEEHFHRLVNPTLQTWWPG